MDAIAWDSCSARRAAANPIPALSFSRGSRNINGRVSEGCYDIYGGNAGELAWLLMMERSNRQGIQGNPGFGGATLGGQTALSRIINMPGSANKMNSASRTANVSTAMDRAGHSNDGIVTLDTTDQIRQVNSATRAFAGGGITSCKNR